MKISRRCPICDRTTTMEIDNWCVENKKTHLMGVKQGKFFKFGYCVTCQDEIYRGRREDD